MINSLCHLLTKEDKTTATSPDSKVSPFPVQSGDKLVIGTYNVVVTRPTYSSKVRLRASRKSITTAVLYIRKMLIENHLNITWASFKPCRCFSKSQSHSLLFLK